MYNGKMRVVEPQCYGRGNKGTELLRGYQVKGDPVKTNKLYDLSKATSIQVLPENFSVPGPGYNKGDVAMKIIFCEL